MRKRLTIKQLVELYHGLQAASKLDSSNFKFTYAVVKNLAVVSKEVVPIIESAERTSKKLIETWGKRNEQGVLLRNEHGYIIPPEHQRDYFAAQTTLNDQMESALRQEEEIELHTIPLEASYFPTSMKPEILTAIFSMIEEV
jgi:hypothetical protein